MTSIMATDFDILVIGAGISSLNAAQRIQSLHPTYTYTILESRHVIDGTWDLFRYPGIRSDSDLYTFGFPWRLWPSMQAIADGASIKRYLIESAKEFEIDKQVRFGHEVVCADWESESQRWTVGVDDKGGKGEGEKRRDVVTAKFVIFGVGYYDNEEPMQANIPGIETFKGMRMPEDLDYKDKKIVIIGSGATAITIFPILAKTASSVTILQRSPTNIVSAPSFDPAPWIRTLFSSRIAHQLIRWKYMWALWLSFQFCRLFPQAATAQIKVATIKELPDSIPQDPHFKPKYNPWEQRLCVCPDENFYVALRAGKAFMVTDTFETVTETRILTTKVEFLEADPIVTATGLKMRFAGSVRMRVDGTAIQPSDKYRWKGTLLQDVPNAATLQGYTNASWTLCAEASIQLVCRILKHMQDRKLGVVVPRVADESKVRPRNLMNLSSTYIVAERGVMPKGGDVGPWKARVNYFKDFWNAKWGGLEALEFIGTLSSEAVGEETPLL